MTRRMAKYEVPYGVCSHYFFLGSWLCLFELRQKATGPLGWHFGGAAPWLPTFCRVFGVADCRWGGIDGTSLYP